MTSRSISQCLTCKWWISPFDRTDANASEAEPVQVCSAFPLDGGGIPEGIWWNRDDHRQPYPGDHGIQWESDGADFPEWAMVGNREQP